MQKRITKLGLPDHIGFVVRDSRSTIDFLTSTFGLGPWDTIDFIQGKEDLIVGAPFTLKIACAKLGPVAMELLEPVEGNSLWSKAIEKGREGIHHLAYTVHNWDEVVSDTKVQGGKMIVGGYYLGKRWCYFKMETGSMIIEFMESYGLSA
jgi:methylmalonyl-CoA/ethylmalonyl-CoA epimerase